MATTDADARQELLDGIAGAADELAFALAALGEAFERLDEATGDRLEAELFRPVQLAFGRARRAHAGFAARHELPGREFEQPSAPGPSTGVREIVDEAAIAVRTADDALAAVQDLPLFIDVGDAELRSAVQELRELIAGVPARAREIVRVLGR